VFNLSLTSVVRQAWERGRRPLIHGLVYSIGDGHLKELVRAVDGPDKAEELAPRV
jgi:carbonic anhydrase